MKKNRLTPTRVIMLGFLAGILLGTFLLWLPVSLKAGVKLDILDSLFVTTSSICVTGLSTINIGQTFSVFGQIIILILIQFGGLGIVTFTTLVLLLFQRRISLSERILLQNAYNLETLSGLIRLMLRILKVTLTIEGIGALCYLTVFVPQYGAKGIWFAVFHAVSAFCNAGIDLLGGNSFCAYRDHIPLNLITIALIIVSGLGFPVYWEIERLAKGHLKKRHVGTYQAKMNLQTKLVLMITAFLIVTGTILTLIFEYHNPATIGTLSFPKKVLASLFQSVTLRTAGFATIDQGLFTNASGMAYLVFMFIGGSPAGTAGGVKTVTVFLLLASMFANIRGKKDVSVFHKTIADDYIRRCVAIVAFSLTTLLILTNVLLFVQGGDFLDTLYEMTSAIATVGLSRGLTGSLTSVGKIVVTLAMYLGRIGPITLALAFNTHTGSGNTSYASSKVVIG